MSCTPEDDLCQVHSEISSWWGGNMAVTLKLMVILRTVVIPNYPSVASNWVDQRMITYKDGNFQVEV